MPTPRLYETDADRQRAYRHRQKQALAEQLASKNLPSTAAIPTMPSMARWTALHNQAQAALQAMQDEMQAYYNDRSEQWQESDRAAAFQDMIDRVEEARTSVDDLTLDA